MKNPTQELQPLMLRCIEQFKMSQLLTQQVWDMIQDMQLTCYKLYMKPFLVVNNGANDNEKFH